MKKLFTFLISLIIINFSFGQFSGGNGSIASPYEISTLNDLKLLSESPQYWSKSFIQTQDIDATQTKDWNNGAGFLPIGRPTDLAPYFWGRYDGRRYAIKNLYINNQDLVYTGLFSYTFCSSSTFDIQGINLVNADITGKSVVGGIVGLNYAYTKDCSVTGKIKGFNYVGGISGIQYYSVNNSFSYCQITGTNTVGGIVGIIYYGEITNSYSSSDLFGNSQIGGLAGDATSAVIRNSYARGKITGNSSLKGLLSGDLSSSTVVTNSFWNKDISGIDTSVGGGSGLSAAEMLVKNTYTSNGWDFVDETINGTQNIWKMDTMNINDGYPIFSYQNASLSTDDKSIIKNVFYPNPVQEYIYFQKPLKKVTIYDLIGRKILESSSATISKLNLHTLQAGTYILKGEMDNNQTTIQNIIKK
ncbi:hypothetical protein J2X97_000002 [Epilithonimonas hungarica]|uniref:T9SS type A sorting domain-containing protein n=1 Tax=Epilithonimonas hungarica TaxID=454006 RepID=UPI0027834E8A|nr:T9SS type A sorting domain-containing protein [Epilithonimonas hungarica]MDP9954365.1 hypothetical protein [Epilithonimonas hungarica]